MTEGWRKHCRGMALNLPQPIRTWLTSPFSTIVSRSSNCLIWALNELNFSTSLSVSGNRWSLRPRCHWQVLDCHSGYRPTDHFWSICETYAVILFFHSIHIWRSSVLFSDVCTVLTCLQDVCLSAELIWPHWRAPAKVRHYAHFTFSRHHFKNNYLH